MPNAGLGDTAFCTTHRVCSSARNRLDYMAMIEPTTTIPAVFTDRAWYAWLVLAAAMVLTATGTIVLQRAITHTDDERFMSAVGNAENSITRRMETYGAMMRGVSGLIDRIADLDHATFATYMQHIDMRRNYPGILALGWIAPVPAGTEADTLGWLSAQGYKQARLWPEPLPGHGRTAVLLIEPDELNNRAVIGFDMSHEETRKQAMMKALEIGDTFASGPLTLIQDRDRGEIPGFVTFLPIFTHGEEQRFRGYVFASFRCSDLFAAMFPDGGDAPLTLTVRDAVSGQVLYDTTSGVSDGVVHSHAALRSFPMLGRTWNIDFRSTQVFDKTSSRGLVPLFTAAGLVLGFGLFLLARAQVRALAQNADLYRISTAARREAELSLDINRRLASTLDPQSVADAVTDAGRELTGAAFGAFFTTGSKPDDLRAYAVTGESSARFFAHGLPRIINLVRAVIAEQEVVRLDDVRVDPRYNHPEPGTAHDATLVVTSFMAVAVRSRTGEVLGGLLYAHIEPAKFSSDHERQLLGLAAQAAIAFDNAQLFAAEREAKRIAGHRADDLSQANAELQQFVYVSSHDLQEPLRTITQYLDLLKRRYLDQLDDQARRYVDYVSEGASRMYVLLNDLLTYSRLGHAAERTQVELTEVVNEVLQDLSVVITETRTQITVDAMPAIRCERAKIRSLFQNLIGNAVKFRGETPPQITLSATTGGGIWTMRVADNGVGIPPEHRIVVFEVFHRLHEREAFPGTGIGLAICRKVVEQHGGRIWIEETPGGGTTFLFTLPEDGSGCVRLAPTS